MRRAATLFLPLLLAACAEPAPNRPLPPGLGSTTAAPASAAAATAPLAAPASAAAAPAPLARPTPITPTSITPTTPAPFALSPAANALGAAPAGNAPPGQQEADYEACRAEATRVVQFRERGQTMRSDETESGRGTVTVAPYGRVESDRMLAQMERDRITQDCLRGARGTAPR